MSANARDIRLRRSDTCGYNHRDHPVHLLEDRLVLVQQGQDHFDVAGRPLVADGELKLDVPDERLDPGLVIDFDDARDRFGDTPAAGVGTGDTCAARRFRVRSPSTHREKVFAVIVGTSGMGEPTVTLRQADETTLSYVVDLLEASGLPSSDVQSKPEWFYVGYHGSDRVGVGGLEVHGRAGLLRSLVVQPSVRGEGLGTALCKAVERRARDEGVETAYLLTTTAAEFFAGLGYDEIERAAAPSPIQQTTEFDTLCPSSAICMRKRL